MARLSNIIDASSNSLNSIRSSMGSASLPRASYVIPSFNTSSTFYGAVFLDSEFNKLTYSSISSYYGTTGAFTSYDGTYTDSTNLFSGVSASQNVQSSNSGYYLSGLWNGEYGSCLIHASERGEFSHNTNRWPTTGQGNYSSYNASFVNSDHSDKTYTVQLRNGILTRSNLLRPWDASITAGYVGPERLQKNITSVFPSGTQIANMYGSASYNNVRKELVVMSYNTTTTGRFDVAIWKNVDWDLNKVNVSLLSSTPDHLWNVTTPNFDVNNNESQRNIKVVLTDNGDIYYSVMYPSNNFRLYRIVRAVGDNSGTVTLLSTLGLTTSYGQDQGIAYGQKAMQTRLGNMVVTYCPYYYYACGLMSFVIDKRNNNWENGRQSTSGSFGMNPLKYRDDSFAFIEAANYYAGNWSAISNTGFASPNPVSGGKPLINSNSWYMPVAPGPNTTNYIGVYHVWDYDLQSIPPAYSGRRN